MEQLNLNATNDEEQDENEDAAGLPPLLNFIQDYDRDLLDSDSKREAFKFISHHVLDDTSIGGGGGGGGGQSGNLLEGGNGEQGDDDDNDGEGQQQGGETGDEIQSELVSGFVSQKTREEFINILLGRLPADQVSRPGSDVTRKKKITEWLRRSNSARGFMFLKSTYLKNEMKKRGIRLKGDQKIDSIIEALAGESTRATTTASTRSTDLEPAKEEAIHRVLEHSFMPHQKGVLREHCTRGHLLEAPILKNWVNEMKAEQRRGRGAFRVRAAYKAGLVSKKHHPWAQDSIDFLAIAGKPAAHPLHEDNDDIHDEIARILGENDVDGEFDAEDEDEDEEVWGIEIKSRLTANTMAREEQYNLNLNRDKHAVIDEEMVCTYIHNVSERFQLLHHSFVYDLEKCVLVVGDESGQVIQSTKIKYSATLKESYGKVLQDLKNFTLYWVYGNDEDDDEDDDDQLRTTQNKTVPEDVIKIATDKLKMVPDAQTIHSSFHLWQAMRKLSLPLPSFKRIIPIYAAYWNVVKGGSDTITKLMDDCILHPPFSHLNLETVATTRCIMVIYTMVHRLLQTFSAKSNIKSYKTLHNYRNCASKRTTFHKSINTVKKRFNSLLVEIEKENYAGSPTQHQSTRRSRARIFNKNQTTSSIPEKIDNVLVPVTGKTPQKTKRAIEKGKAASPIVQRWEQCRGMPFLVEKYVIDKHGNQTRRRQRYPCGECGSKTSWRCLVCKEWFCIEVQEDSKNKKRKFQLIQSDIIEAGPTNFQYSCFHAKHRMAWESNSNDSDDT